MKALAAITFLVAVFLAAFFTWAIIGTYRYHVHCYQIGGEMVSNNGRTWRCTK